MAARMIRANSVFTEAIEGPIPQVHIFMPPDTRPSSGFGGG